MFEIIGTIASFIVLISFAMNNERNIRLVNIIGAVVFVVYGIVISAFSIWFLNSMLVVIHLVKLKNINN